MGFEPMFSDYEPDKLPTTKFYQINFISNMNKT
jgi:hypothetical protein